jgi:acyl transferase domain-containing protein/acyl carrier protein
MDIIESSPQLEALGILKAKGVYLITGGLGELGLTFAQYLVQKVKARLVLTGRSEIEGESFLKLQELENAGGEVLYVKADVSKKHDVEDLVSTAKGRFGRIDGVIHSAGVIRDAFVLKKSDEEIKSVLASKVFGTKNLDEALKDETLDFFVLFSSVAAVLGNIGQSDYGYANSYLDNFAQWRDAQCKAGKRSGKTLSINWPLWEDGKMAVNDEKLNIMKEAFGMVPLSKEGGIPAFEYGLQQSGSQLIVINGEGEKIQSAINAMLEHKGNVSGTNSRTSPLENGSRKADGGSKILLARTENFLKELISDKTRISLDKIRSDGSFGKYGIESVTIMSLTKTMEEKLGDLSKTLFYEYSNISELAEFLVEHKKDALTKLFGLTDERRPEKVQKKAVLPKTPRVEKHTKLRQETEVRDQEIAIIGVAGRYPMAQNLDEFWENLKMGKDCITEIPDDRWDHSLYYDSEKGTLGKTYSKWGGFLDDVEMFDAQFFQILPNEAMFIDPQERLFLETTWNAIEDSGYSSKSLKGKKVGVFVGAMYGLYQLLETEQFGNRMSGRSSFASIANRVSYFFDFQGPSMALDTMCSSSLVALHLGCDSIRKGESEMVIAGGVNLSLHPNKYLQLSIGSFCSTDGRCRSFGQDGDGYVPGEGVGAVVLKPLSKAIEDGNQIYAVIKESSINSGGRTSGYTVPNPNAQTELIKDTLKKANIDSRTISYMEAHGTGTALGDPIEITGLTKAFREYTDENQYCSIGSVKSNIGHLESAAGIAAVTKVLLQMKHKTLVPSIHSEQLNPFIDFNSTPFYVQHTLQEWKKPVIKTESGEKSYPRRAGISAFGAGGANAHIILEEYEKEVEPLPNGDGSPQLFILSAKNKERLQAYAEQLNAVLDNYIPGDVSSQSPKANTDSVEPIKDIKNLIQQEVAEILCISQAEVDFDEPFSDYGLSTYDLTMLSAGLQRKLGLEIPLNVVAYNSTVNRLAEYLSSYCPIDSTAKAELPSQSHSEISLADLAFTLQVGRDGMQERLAVIAGNIHDLKEGLSDYCNGKKGNPNLKQGNISDFIEKFDVLLNGEIAKEQMKRFLEERDIVKIAELWVMGADVEWHSMYENQTRNRISLPAYPFEKKRHWITPIGSDNRLIPNMQKQDTIAVKHDSSPGHQTEVPVMDRKDILPADNEKVNDTMLKDAVLEYLKQVFSEVFNIPNDYFSPNENFENYGIDSIHIHQLNRYFEQVFGKLPSTLLFTYKNLKSLSSYFVEHQREKVISVLSSGVNLDYTESSDERVEEVESAPKPLQPVVEEAASEEEQGIAIIGISGSFPQAENIDQFMKNLRDAKDCITEIPEERWDHRQYPDIACKWGGFVDDADKFDPQFFNIAPINASFMDPQERLFLQSVWSCLEDAGYTPDSLADPDDEDQRGNVAVYAGVTFNTYSLLGAADIERGNMVPINSQIYSVANRVSYLLNLKGPSLSVDTACSSSLYAIHLGCESILRDECDMAIAGGVNLSLHPSKYITLDSAKFLASDGHCRSFGEGGDGYVPGEGVGVVLLKPLWKAKRDRDHIYGVIKGSAVNHDGKTNGYTVPNPVAQKDVIKKALKRAKMDARTISYVEAHGTGTSLGDPIEITALTDAYGGYTSQKQYCAIGSVKSNIGHLEAAAGIAQVAKVLLQMKHKTLFPSRLNAEQINPNIDFAETPFQVQLEAEEWKKPVIGSSKEVPRRSGISSFGVGGVNVHIIIEEYESDARPFITNNEKAVIIPLSAKNENALKRYVIRLHQYLAGKLDKQTQTADQTNTLPDIRDMAFTMQTGRIALPYRAAFVASDYEEFKQLLESYIIGDGIGPSRGLITGKALSARERMKLGQPAAIQVKISEESDSYAIAKQWVEGYVIPFSDLYSDYLPYRISLPVYPFEKERYWMYSAPDTTASAQAEMAESVSEPVEELTQTANEDDKDPNSVDMKFLYQLADSFESEQLPLMIHYIQEIFASLLGFTEGRLPDPEHGFFELGLESIAIAEGYNKLQKVFGLELDEQIFFNYPNIIEVSNYILPMLNLDELEVPIEAEDVIGLMEAQSEAAADIEAEPELEVELETSMEEITQLHSTNLFLIELDDSQDEALMKEIDNLSEAELIAMLQMEIDSE